MAWPPGGCHTTGREEQPRLQKHANGRKNKWPMKLVSVGFAMKPMLNLLRKWSVGFSATLVTIGFILFVLVWT